MTHRTRWFPLTLMLAGALGVAACDLAPLPTEADATLAPDDLAAAKLANATICHATGNLENPWVEITVNGNAVPAHLAHGDFIILEGLTCPPSDDPPLPG